MGAAARLGAEQEPKRQVSLKGRQTGEISEWIEPLGTEDFPPTPSCPGCCCCSRPTVPFGKGSPVRGGMKIRAPPQLQPFCVHKLASLT